MTSNYNLTSFDSSEKLAIALSVEIAEILNTSIEKNGKATLLVSGGNTPKLFFEKLSHQDIDWSNVYIGLVDERCVNNKHEDSNENLVKKHLIKNLARNATFISMYSKDFELNSVNKSYHKYFFRTDVLVLGMGEDGHTASIFPELDDLDKLYKSQEFCEVTKPKNAEYERITLSLGSILNAKNIFLHIEGKNKYKVFCKAAKDKDLFPISKILYNDKKTIEVYFS